VERTLRSFAAEAARCKLDTILCKLDFTYAACKNRLRRCKPLIDAGAPRRIDRLDSNDRLISNYSLDTAVLKNNANLDDLDSLVSSKSSTNYPTAYNKPNSNSSSNNNNNNNIYSSFVLEPCVCAKELVLADGTKGACSSNNNSGSNSSSSYCIVQHSPCLTFGLDGSVELSTPFSKLNHFIHISFLLCKNDDNFV